jgi:predicted nucleotidyltransferase
MTQRLVHESALLIDLVPFGGLEEIRGQISWPPDFSIVMSTVGFREAYDHSVEVRIADDLIVKVASLPGLALMKIVAWDERHFERDAQDLGLIMRQYLAAGNEGRVYSEQGDCLDLLNEQFDYLTVSARVLGRDVSLLLSNSSRAVLERVLSPAMDQRNVDALTTAMIRSSAVDYDVTLSMLAELRHGISESGS